MSSDENDYPSAGEIAKSVVILFLSGVAILVGLILTVYIIALIFDKWCCCCPGFQALHTDGPRYVSGGAVARDAGLLGMTSAERRAILEKVLISKPYKKNSLVHSSTTGSKEAPRKDETSETARRNDAQDVEKGLSPRQSSAHRLNVVDDLNHDTTCAICINEYEEGELVMTGNSCTHIFHKECLLEWLDKHDVCPYCRENMMTSEQMREAAMSELGGERMMELATRYRLATETVPGAADNGTDADAEAGVGPITTEDSSTADSSRLQEQAAL